MFVSFIFLTFLLAFSESSCPDGSLEYTGNCYVFNSTESGFSKAEFTCMQLGGHLTSIHDAFTNGLIGEEAPDKFQQSKETDFWIGANKLLSDGNWSWTDGAPIDFTDWKQGEPQNASGTNCAALSMTDGYWYTQDCFKAKPFVCIFSPSTTILPSNYTLPTWNSTMTTPKTLTTTSSDLNCTDGWLYFEATHSCYHFFSREKHWQDAEDYCKDYRAHLSSIHSYNELVFVAKNSDGYPWLGGYTDNNATTWNWSDDTPMDYVHWYDLPPVNAKDGSCLTINYVYANNNVTGGYFSVDCYRSNQVICKKAN